MCRVNEIAPEKLLSSRITRAKYTFSVATELKKSYPDISMALAFSSIETFELKGKNYGSWENIQEFLKMTPKEIKESFLISQLKYTRPLKDHISTFNEIIYALWKEFRCNFLHDGFWHWHPELKYGNINQFYFLSKGKRVGICQSDLVDDFLSLIEKTINQIETSYKVI